MLRLGVEGNALPIEVAIVATVFQDGVVGSGNLVGVAVDNLMPVVYGTAESAEIVDFEIFLLSEYLYEITICYRVVVAVGKHNSLGYGVAKCHNFCLFHILFFCWLRRKSSAMSVPR